MCRLLRGALGRFAQTGQCRADGALCFQKTLPDPIRRRIAQAAIEIAKRLPSIAAGHCIFEKGPQTVSGQEKAPDLIGPPDVEGPSTTGRSVSIAAKDPLRSSRFPTLVFIVVSSQISMPNQVPHTPAVRTRRQLQVGHNRIELLVGFANAHENDSPQTSYVKAAIVENPHAKLVAKNGGGVRCLRQERQMCGVGWVCRMREAASLAELRVQ